MSKSARLGLSMLEPGQAQKEITHNEALVLLDGLVQGVVEGAPIAVPPASPVVGDVYLVDEQPSGAFAGQAGSVAIFTEGGWRFVAPRTGMEFVDRVSRQKWRREPSGWELGVIEAGEIRIDGLGVLTAQQAAIADPSGGATVDTQARQAVVRLLSALRTHGMIAT